ncbi:MAG: aspartate aminotransferase [Candidatus Sumerlaeota bacterium]|nr:aspartate aminotransferase [Candidatus Sumerlaeota bacterium]
MKVSQRCSKLSPSLTLALTAKAKALRAEGIDVMSFGAGEPDFDTPDFVKQVVVEDLKAGKTKYTAAKGGPEILEAVQFLLKRDYNLEYDVPELLVSVGGKHSLYNIFQAIVDPGDEVIIPSPFWLSYPDQVKAADGEPVVVPCGPEQNFKITPDQLAKAITPKTAAFIFNSPNNPTGAVYTKAEILALADVLKKHPHVVIVSDDLYMKLVYAPAEFHSIVSLAPELKERTIIVNGWSKAYAMTGWRLGWLAGPAPLVKAMTSLQSHSTSNVTTFIQRAAAVAAKSNEGFLHEWVKTFDERRKLLVDGLNALPGVSCKPAPQGAFYAFPDISGLYGKTFAGKKVTNSLEFADVALEKARVSVVPGVAFGEDRCVRLSYATSNQTIETGLQRLREFIEAAG